MTAAVVAALITSLAGFSLLIGGVYTLFGLGWALLTSALPCFLITAVILRGL